jgi:hypothetical protein
LEGGFLEKPRMLQESEGGCEARTPGTGAAAATAARPANGPPRPAGAKYAAVEIDGTNGSVISVFVETTAGNVTEGDIEGGAGACPLQPRRLLAGRPGS